MLELAATPLSYGAAFSPLRTPSDDTHAGESAMATPSKSGMINGYLTFLTP